MDTQALPHSEAIIPYDLKEQEKYSAIPKKTWIR